MYTDEHLERLALIGELRDRGLTLQTIRELVATDTPDDTVSEWLGVDATLTAPWSDDRPRTLTHDELARLMARTAHRPGVIGELQAAGFVQPQPTDVDGRQPDAAAPRAAAPSGRRRHRHQRAGARPVPSTTRQGGRRHRQAARRAHGHRIRRWRIARRARDRDRGASTGRPRRCRASSSPRKSNGPWPTSSDAGPKRLGRARRR